MASMVVDVDELDWHVLAAAADDDDVDLFGDDDEEESEQTKQRLAAYAEKKSKSNWQNLKIPSRENIKISFSGL